MFVSKYNKFDLLKNTYRYKVFKKNLKFKKLNRGITKFIINRKKYLKRKKKTNLVLYYQVALFWSKLYSKKKRCISFFYFLNSFKKTFLVTNVTFLRNYPIKLKTSYNTASLSKRLFLMYWGGAKQSTFSTHDIIFYSTNSADLAPKNITEVYNITSRYSSNLPSSKTYTPPLVMQKILISKFLSTTCLIIKSLRKIILGLIILKTY